MDNCGRAAGSGEGPKAASYSHSITLYADIRASVSPGGTRTVFARYAHTIQPATLDAMKAEFYNITQSPKYTRDALSQSVAYSSLNSAWNGINGWRT